MEYINLITSRSAKPVPVYGYKTKIANKWVFRNLGVKLRKHNFRTIDAKVKAEMASGEIYRELLAAKERTGIDCEIKLRFKTAIYVSFPNSEVEGYYNLEPYKINPELYEV